MMENTDFLKQLIQTAAVQEALQRVKGNLEQGSEALDTQLPHKSKAEAPVIPQAEDLAAKVDRLTTLIEAMLAKEPAEVEVETGEMAQPTEGGEDMATQFKAMQEYVKMCDQRIKALEDMMGAQKARAVSVQDANLPQLINDVEAYQQKSQGVNPVIAGFWSTVGGNK